ncbi:MAG: T9SS type A sorting domain-containing protein, partial [Nitrososphaerales archaeon]
TRWITRVAVDPDDAMIAYVTLSGFRYDEYLPHVFRTTNAGISWLDISSNLPDAPVNDIIVDPDSTERLYVGTDVGVFVSDNLGSTWNYLGSDLPNAPITDLVFHNPTRKLIAATYGRSMYSIDLSQNPAITLVFPNGGQHFLMGDQIQITWASNQVDSVKIQLSLADVGNWITIEEATESDGIYDWIVQAPFTSWECRIKISDVSDSTVNDKSDTTFVIDTFPSVDDSTNSNLPVEFALFQNYPNPFNPVTSIQYVVSSSQFVTLKVFDVLGNEIATLVNEEKHPGIFEVEFDGMELPSGIYFYKLKAGNFIETKKMILIK